MGKSFNGGDLDNNVAGALPLQLDLNWSFHRLWAAGAYFSYGPTFVADFAKHYAEELGATDVSGRFLRRLGAQGAYHNPPTGPVVHWVGVAAGYEWNWYEQGRILNDYRIGYEGWEGAIQAGADFRAGQHMWLGPYAQFSIGRYSTFNLVLAGEDQGYAIHEQAMHQWLQLGIRTIWR
jgi:hypothetical protein